jgi:uncharacterized protein with NAD-binding domain and iron-sulfur cluster
VAREKIVILGGGMGSMAAAYALSRPGWQERYESITVYQVGWRIGGKGASGRGRYDRIEEHGLHLWLGFYENAFRVMQECYAELGRPAGAPLARWDGAFKKASFVVVEDEHNGTWRHWPTAFPEDDRVPGVPDPRDPAFTVWAYVTRALGFLMRLPGVRAHVTAAVGPHVAAGRHSLWRDVTRPASGLAQEAEALLEGAEASALAAAMELAIHLPDDVRQHDPAHHRLLHRLLVVFATWLRARVEAALDRDHDARWTWQIADILLAAIRGILAHGLHADPAGFDPVDEYELIDWLLLHGASPKAVTSPVLRGAYDLAFAYRDGDATRPALSAAQGLRGCSRMFFGYKGAMLWKMQAGMGDVVFAPLYEVLRRRGVQFRFFHRVKALRLASDQRSIGAIEIARQVDLVDPAREYDPLVDVGGLPCWPSEPRWEQIRDAERARGHDLESFWAPWTDAGEVVLKAGEDFDRIVFGISLGSVPYVCADLVAHSERWRQMVERVETVQTQAFQLWMSQDVKDLGWTMPQADLSGYVEPFDTYADMRQLIQRERWPADDPARAIAYFCNVMPTARERRVPPDPAFEAAADDEVKRNALRFMQKDLAHLWPKVVGGGDVRWDLLAGGGDARGIGRFDAQYWRANVDPSERYVLSVPGSDKYRMRTDATGYANLYLAGDWIDCGFNAGCVEAATMAGLLASSAISGFPRPKDIVGAQHP